MSKPPIAQEFSAEPGGKLEVVTFFSGGQRCAVAARQVSALRPCADSAGCPALDPLLGMQQQDKAASTRQALTLRLPQAELEFSVASPVELREMDIGVIHPLPDMILARTHLRGLRALALENDGLTLIFDLNMPLNSAPQDSGLSGQDLAETMHVTTV
ncbi:MAG: hypothetical protein Q8O38_13540 [Sulfurimicrobium sp.]|nr:hypothetical protein [Sulfurimicrobium sp.]